METEFLSRLFTEPLKQFLKLTFKNLLLTSLENTSCNAYKHRILHSIFISDVFPRYFSKW
jgi:hypothetical protein